MVSYVADTSCVDAHSKPTDTTHTSVHRHADDVSPHPQCRKASQALPGRHAACPDTAGHAQQVYRDSRLNNVDADMRPTPITVELLVSDEHSSSLGAPRIIHANHCTLVVSKRHHMAFPVGAGIHMLHSPTILRSHIGCHTSHHVVTHVNCSLVVGHCLCVLNRCHRVHRSTFGCQQQLCCKGTNLIGGKANRLDRTPIRRPLVKHQKHPVGVAVPAWDNVNRCVVGFGCGALGAAHNIIIHQVVTIASRNLTATRAAR